LRSLRLWAGESHLQSCNLLRLDSNTTLDKPTDIFSKCLLPEHQATRRIPIFLLHCDHQPVQVVCAGKNVKDGFFAQGIPPLASNRIALLQMILNNHILTA